MSSELVVLSGRSASGQQPDHQASTSANGAPPLGLGLGHASSADVQERIVDRSKGHVLVDPNTLHPPALSPDGNDGFTVKDFTNNRWIAVRYFDSHLNHIGSIRSAKYDGINYNYTTGKAVELHAHFIEIDTMQPVDGTADHEFSKFLGSDYGPVIGSRGQVLANSSGRIDYSPQFGSILYEAGPHPIDSFFADDPSGILPVCSALK